MACWRRPAGGCTRVGASATVGGPAGTGVGLWRATVNGSAGTGIRDAGFIARPVNGFRRGNPPWLPSPSPPTGQAPSGPGFSPVRCPGVAPVTHPVGRKFGNGARGWGIDRIGECDARRPRYTHPVAMSSRHNQSPHPGLCLASILVGLGTGEARASEPEEPREARGEGASGGKRGEATVGVGESGPGRYLLPSVPLAPLTPPLKGTSESLRACPRITSPFCEA